MNQIISNVLPFVHVAFVLVGAASQDIKGCDNKMADRRSREHIELALAVQTARVVAACRCAAGCFSAPAAVTLSNCSRAAFKGATETERNTRLSLTHMHTLYMCHTLGVVILPISHKPMKTNLY